MSWLHVPCQAIILRVLHVCVSCRVINIPCFAVSRFFILAPAFFFYWGAATPQTSCFWGLPAPQFPWQSARSPHAPIARFLRGSASQAIRFFGTRILVSGAWYEDLDTKILEPRSYDQNLDSGSWYKDAYRVLNVAYHSVSMPFV